MSLSLSQHKHFHIISLQQVDNLRSFLYRCLIYVVMAKRDWHSRAIFSRGRAFAGRVIAVKVIAFVVSPLEVVNFTTIFVFN